MITRILFLSAVLFSSLLHAAETAVEDLLRQGLFEEEANRDFDKAAERYRAVVAAHDKQRALAATATYRLGEIARKKNDKEAAGQAFRTVIERFPEQADLARLSRENLGAMGMETATQISPAAAMDSGDAIGGGAASTSVFTLDPQDIEIRDLKKIAKSSPDLLDGADASGWRPLHNAAKNGWVRVISYLLENHADPNSRTTKEQLSPLQIAAIHGHLGAASRLLEAGAKINADTWLSSIPPELLPARVRDAEKASGEWTALDFSILYDRREIARALVKAGADVKRTGPELQRFSGELTSLQVAMCLGRTELAKELLAAGAPANSTGKTRISPLLVAVLSNREMVDPLLKAGANPDSGESVTGISPLAKAVENGLTDIAKVLVGAGANVNAADKESRQPLHLARSAEIVELLVSKGADPNAQSTDGTTPLEMATMWGKEEFIPVFEALLRLGAKMRNPAGLLKLASGPMLDVVRRLAIYPALRRADSVLFSFSNGEKESNFAATVEIRPAEGSPPPSVLESLWLLCQSQGRGRSRGSSQIVSQIRVLRGESEGGLQKSFEWNASGGDGKRPALPALEWGDILEVQMGYMNQDAGANFSLQAFLDAPEVKTVTYRLNGVPFVRPLEDFGYWLGSLDAVAEAVPGQAVVQPQQPPQPGQARPRAARAPEAIRHGFTGLGNIPWLADRSRVSVRRKGVTDAILPGLDSNKTWPFRLVEGDIVDFVLSEAVSKELEQNSRVLLLADDLRTGGLVGAGDLSTILTESQEQTGMAFDWTGVRILSGGDPEKARKKDVKAWMDSLPGNMPTVENPWNWEEIKKKEEKVAGGDWVILPMAGNSRDSDASQQILQKLRSLPSAPRFSPPSQPRERVVPPPVPPNNNR